MLRSGKEGREVTFELRVCAKALLWRELLRVEQKKNLRGGGEWPGEVERGAELGRGFSFQVRAMTEVGVRAEGLGSGRAPDWLVKIRW